MININTTDKNKWREIETLHLAYCRKLVEAKIKDVKPINTKKIKNLFESNMQQKVDNDLSNVENKEEYSKTFAFGISLIKKYLSDDNVKRIVLANGDTFEEINKEIRASIITRKIPILSYIYEKFIYITLSEIFSYKHFQGNGYEITTEVQGEENKGIRWNRNMLLSSIDLRVCPYCNRQYITSYDNDKKSTADADHYYSQSKFPWLKLSLYNLIPSCAVCNRTFKGNKINKDDDNTLYPYSVEDISKHIKFDIDFPRDENGKPCCKAFYNPKRPDINISVVAHNEEANQSKKIFKLEDVYRAHKIEVYELLQRMIHYNQKMRKELIDRSHGLLDEITIRSMLYDFYEDDLGKKPLSKLKCDIYGKYYIEDKAN